MKHLIAAAGLVVLGCAQMAGDLSGNRTLRAIGLATQASPAPKVFTAQEGFETFSARFFVDWNDTAGHSHTLEITPATYSAVKGPYNRRNAYGGALSYGPVLASNEKTRPMLDSVMHFAFCGKAPLLAELSIPIETVRYPITIRLEPRDVTAVASGRWQTVFVVSCAEGRT